MSTISEILSNPPNNFSTTLSGNVSSSGLTLALNDVTGLGTEGVGVIYQKDSDGNPVTSTIEFIHWTGVSSLNLTLTDTGDRGISGSASGAQAHNSGDTFEVWTHSAYYPLNAVTLSAAQTLTNKTLTSPVINTPKINEAVAVVATATEINLLSGKTALGAFWDTVPGTPTRVSDTQFTITDTGNANKYDLLFKKGVILKWDESGTTNIGMVISSSYATNVVTVNIVGDSLTAGFTSMKYCIQMAMVEQFIIPGTLGTGTDLAKTWYPSQDVCKLSVDARVKTAGTTNATVFDVNDDGTTIITTKPSIASAGTSDLDNVCDAPTTVIAASSAVTIDIDSVSTTPPVEAYIYLFYFPSSWLYRN